MEELTKQIIIGEQETEIRGFNLVSHIILRIDSLTKVLQSHSFSFGEWRASRY